MAPIFIQIWIWVMQPDVWRFLGFTSAAVGLLCYALSSSFNYLFGNWNLFKIILYTVFSFIICLVILFAKSLQHSRSLRFKAHTAFLILTITSLYSFFFDKVVNGKPDAYSLISCSSFAIMSLSLSRRKIQCGFEVDLLYFFLGCLLVQLMKIKLLLFTVGACFSYLLIILRSCFSSMDAVIDDEDPNSLQDENSLVVIEIHSDSLQQTGTNTMVEEVSNYMKLLQEETSNHVDMLLEQLKEYRISDPNFDGMKENSNLMIDALSPETINNLHKKGQLMISAGFEKDFSQVYRSCRKECLGESLSRLGFKKLSIEEVNILSRQEIEDEIELWIKSSNVAFKILFPTERCLCDRVFFGFSSAAGLSFRDVCRESTFQLLNFAKAIAIGSRSPDRLFRILDVFETLRDLIPEIEVLFCDQYSVSLRNEALTIWKRLGEAIRGIFMELENLIRRDPAKAGVPGGGLHPITRYVMNYLRAACRSQQTLEQVFEDYGHPLKEFPKIDDRMHSSSSLSVQMDWIMELLESNLEAKSRIYKDPALCYVFLINNFKYIVQKAEDGDLGALLGDDWIKKHTAKIRQYHMQYQICSWNKVFGFLKLEDSGSVPPNAVAKSMKEKLKSFNMAFDDLCRVQSSWFIFDIRLKEEIRNSIEKLLVPAYRKFIGRFSHVEVGKNIDKYVKYETEDIEVKLNDLFQGSSGSTGSRKRN